MLKADIRTSGDQDMGIRELGYQEQKQNPISRYLDNHPLITRYPDILRVILVICALSFVIIFNVYALNLDKVKVNFLNGDYKSAILEGEKILASAGNSSGLDELYYILGLSYLKDGNYLRASDIFEIILKEFRNSQFQEEAKLGLGDAYFLRGDFSKAEGYYRDLNNSNPRTKFKAQVYYRLSQVGFKKGDARQGKEYSDKLKQDFPSNLELKMDKDFSEIPASHVEFYYTVQVGSFSNSINANNLTQKLIQEGYPAYVEDAQDQGGNKIYRVRVGKLRQRQEAIDFENKLSQQGYPTKVCP